MSKFEAKTKLMKMQGKDYLPVNWRIVWFREDHPKVAIVTELAGEGLIKATVIDSDGKVLATGHGSPKMQGVAKARIARALVLEPEIFFLDEPTASEDQQNREIIDEIIKNLTRESRSTIIIATHDARQAERLADRLLYIKDCQISERTR